MRWQSFKTSKLYAWASAASERWRHRRTAWLAGWLLMARPLASLLYCSAHCGPASWFRPYVDACCTTATNDCRYKLARPYKSHQAEFQDIKTVCLGIGSK